MGGAYCRLASFNSAIDCIQLVGGTELTYIHVVPQSNTQLAQQTGTGRSGSRNARPTQANRHTPREKTQTYSDPEATQQPLRQWAGCMFQKTMVLRAQDNKHGATTIPHITGPWAPHTDGFSRNKNASFLHIVMIDLTKRLDHYSPVQPPYRPPKATRSKEWGVQAAAVAYMPHVQCLRKGDRDKSTYIRITLCNSSKIVHHDSTPIRALLAKKGGV